MKIVLSHNFPDVIRQVDQLGKAAPRVLREALNRTADWAQTDVVRQMRRVFDRPIPYTLRSLRTFYASTSNLTATLWFKQRRADEDKLWAVPQIHGGSRATKPMELRLERVGILPRGWRVMPGEGAPLDAYGNISPGEISRVLNVLGMYTEAGYNKANDKTRARLRKGNARRGQYGFEYWVNPVGARRQKHLQPGVYRRVYTAYGTSLKPIMIFVSGAKYRMRLDFFGIVEASMQRHLPVEFDKAMKSFMQTGSASAIRRAR